MWSQDSEHFEGEQDYEEHIYEDRNNNTSRHKTIYGDKNNHASRFTKIYEVKNNCLVLSMADEENIRLSKESELAGEAYELRYLQSEKTHIVKKKISNVEK